MFLIFGRRRARLLARALLIFGFAFMLATASTAAAQSLGDLTDDGTVSLADANRLWRIVRGLASATAQDSVRGDVFPRPGTGGRSVGDGLLAPDDVDRLLDLLLGNIAPASFYGQVAITEVWPPAATPGDTLYCLSILGNAFLGGSAVTFEPPSGINVDSVWVVSDSLLRVQARLASTATPGARQVRVTTASGTSPTGSSSAFTIFPPSGPPPALYYPLSSLNLLAGAAPGFITLGLTPADAGTSTINAASGDASIASVPATTGAPAGATQAVVEVTPVAVGSTQVTGDWLGLPFAVTVNVTAPHFSVFPTSLSLFQVGLTDSLELYLTPQMQARTISLSSSNAALASVPSSIIIEAGRRTVRFEVVPGLSTGDAVITARLPASLGGEALQVPVHVEPLRLTIYGATSPIRLSDNLIRDDPTTPDIDEGFGIGTSGVILALNGASRLPQVVWLDALPPYYPGISGFSARSPVVIPPNEVFWADHFGGIIYESRTPPFGGVVRARLDIDPATISTAATSMAFGPPNRSAVRFCDTEVGMVPGAAPRHVVAIVDQANGRLEAPPDWSYTVTGSAVTVDTMTNETGAALFFRVTPRAPGSSVIRVICDPGGLTDSIRVNVLSPQVGGGTATAHPGTEAPQWPAGSLIVNELSGLDVVEDQATVPVPVTLPKVENARGKLTVVVTPDSFSVRPDNGPNIAPGSSDKTITVLTMRIEDDDDLRNGRETVLQWNVRDRAGVVVNPGRYRVKVMVEPQGRDLARAIGTGNGIQKEVNPRTILNMAQVVYLLFPPGFRKDMELFELNFNVDAPALEQIIRYQVQQEYREQSRVNLVTTLTRPQGFAYTTMEFSGGDPNNEAEGRAGYDLGNQDPGQQCLHARKEGVFPRSIHDNFANRAPAAMRAEFNRVFKTPGRNDYFAWFIAAHMLSYVAVHELGHTLGLTAGDVIGAYAARRPVGVVPFTNNHNNNGASDTPGGRFYMDDGRWQNFRELGAINPLATFPLAAADIGMEPPNDFSARFNPVNLTYLKRLLPRGEDVR